MRLTSFFIFVLGSTALGSFEKEGFTIHTDLNYKMKSGKVVTASKDFILPRNNHGWVTLTDIKDEVILLGKMVKSDAETIHMEYLLIDGTEKPNGIVSTPAMIAKLNAKSEISVGKTLDSPDMSVSLLATPTKFSSE